MSVKCFFLMAALFLLTTMGWAAPQQPYGQQPGLNPRSIPVDDINTILKQLKTGLTDLKHEMRNHEAEIRMFDNKQQSQEASFEHLKQQLIDDVQAQRDFVRASSVNFDGKVEALNQAINNLENLNRNLTQDLRQVKTQFNESIVILGQYKQKISDMETLLQVQNQQMQNLEAALQSMMEVWQAKETAKEIVKEIANKASEPGKTYKVQSGDSLGKIAQTHKVSVQALRDANQLANDRIIIGQTLKIP